MCTYIIISLGYFFYWSPKLSIVPLQLCMGVFPFVDIYFYSFNELWVPELICNPWHKPRALGVHVWVYSPPPSPSFLAVGVHLKDDCSCLLISHLFVVKPEASAHVTGRFADSRFCLVSKEQ